MRVLVIALALVACKSDKSPPPAPPVPTPTSSSKETTPTPTPGKPAGHGVTVTPKGDDFELADGRFSVVFPDEPKIEVDPQDGTLTAEGGKGVNVYTLSIIHGDEIKGEHDELPHVIGGIFQGLTGKLGTQTPYPPHGLAFDGTATDAGETWQVVGWTLAQPKEKRIYVLMFQLPNDRTFTRRDAESVASTLKLL